MEKSSEIEKIATALAKVQADMEPLLKDSKGYNYKYADLASVWDTIRKVMTDNGIAVWQGGDYSGPGTVAVTTMLTHSSGQWIQSTLSMPLKANSTAQDVGSAITYARRYALMAALGVAPEDDDGASASGKLTAKQAPKPVDMGALKSEFLRDFSAAKSVEDRKAIALKVKSSPLAQPDKDELLTKFRSEINK